jgi:hypothetical protein
MLFASVRRSPLAPRQHTTLAPLLQGLDPAVALFHSLSDPTRLTIVARLAAGEARVRDLVEQTGLAQSFDPVAASRVSAVASRSISSGRSRA